jgi:uncharacterized protein VirK/YbjX
MTNLNKPSYPNNISPKNTIIDVLSSIYRDFFADFKSMTILVAGARVLRRGKLLFMPDFRTQMLKNAAYQSHIQKIDKNDSIFFFSHRHYLAKGLTSEQRAQTAMLHYEHEINGFDEAYYNSVYCEAGLTLWSKNVDNILFDIRLMPGNDVLYEGACSIVFHINGARVCVVNYTLTPTEVFALDKSKLKANYKLGESILFVSRKQSTGDHSYQKDFNRIFDRTTPAHLCFGALTAIALAQGHSAFVGITPEVHPSINDDVAKFFDVAYTQFWESLDGEKVSPYGYLMTLPMEMTPLDELDAKARKRAIARRQHIDDVFTEASIVVQKHLLKPQSTNA